VASVKIHRVKLPKKNELDFYFVTGDWHSEHYSRPTFEMMLQHAQKLPKKNRKLIINGDFLDCPEFMTKFLGAIKMETIRSNMEYIYMPAAEREYEWGCLIFEQLLEVFLPENIIFGLGNHDWRLENFMELYAPKIYKPYFNIDLGLKLSERGIRIYKYNDWLDIGKVSITHGMYHGMSAGLRHYNACGHSVIFNHVHQFTARSFVRREDTVIAWSNPCMSTLAPEYTKNAENNWSDGYGVLAVRSNGMFNYNVFLNVNNQIVLPDGTVLSGNK